MSGVCSAMIEMLRLEMSVWEIGLRGSIGFVALDRVVPKRNAGHILPNDMLAQ